ncbi:cleavage and polyadenylation specificity factor subunit 6-like [Penaeus monodon]|uniref:cleavage and polyadenylation specificity factor subunit 6-like n=1 Tax=Penaeus monodon TaxID=6687 RepID=UPI0018A6FF21|nr:cleavage and polyadenylation specificity factor subunit 6-like [Penaeus monodon]
MSTRAAPRSPKFSPGCKVSLFPGGPRGGIQKSDDGELCRKTYAKGPLLALGNPTTVRPASGPPGPQGGGGPWIHPPGNQFGAPGRFAPPDHRPERDWGQGQAVKPGGLLGQHGGGARMGQGGHLLVDPTGPPAERLRV